MTRSMSVFDKLNNGDPEMWDGLDNIRAKLEEIFLPEETPAAITPIPIQRGVACWSAVIDTAFDTIKSLRMADQECLGPMPYYVLKAVYFGVIACVPAAREEILAAGKRTPGDVSRCERIERWFEPFFAGFPGFHFYETTRKCQADLPPPVLPDSVGSFPTAERAWVAKDTKNMIRGGTHEQGQATGGGPCTSTTEDLLLDFLMEENRGLPYGPSKGEKKARRSWKCEPFQRHTESLDRLFLLLEGLRADADLLLIAAQNGDPEVYSKSKVFGCGLPHEHSDAFGYISTTDAVLADFEGHAGMWGPMDDIDHRGNTIPSCIRTKNPDRDTA